MVYLRSKKSVKGAVVRKASSGKYSNESKSYKADSSTKTQIVSVDEYKKAINS